MTASVTASPRWRALLCDDVAAYETAVFDHAADLLPQEAELVRSAVPSRVEEFAAGRACARRALADLGFSSGPLLREQDRRPAWPPACRGSITHTQTHTQGHCAAAVARDDACIGLGIDVEALGRLSEDLERRICTPQEIARLAAMTRQDRERAATIIFSAKEAFYKSQSHLPGAVRGFHDVEVELLDGVFVVIPRRPLSPALQVARELSGRYRIEGGLVYSGIVMR